MTEQERIMAVKAGSTEEFGALYDAYAEKIYRYVFYRTRDKETAEDLVSTTFFKAIENISRFKEGNFSAWLYRIARNTLFDHYRTARRMQPLEDAEAVFADAHLEEELADMEEVKKLKALFTELSEAQREVLTMRIWDGLSYAEIGAVIGKTEAASKMMFHRAIVRLRELAPMAVALLLLQTLINS